MKRFLLGLAVCSILAGCGSSPEVQYDFDPIANFSQYHTFQWIPGQSQGTDSTMYDSRIKRAITLNLTQRGMVPGASNSELMISSEFPSLEFQTPTLSIEMVDGQSKHLVWQGSWPVSLSNNATPQELDETFQKAVDAILAYYPPPPPQK